MRLRDPVPHGDAPAGLQAPPFSARLEPGDRRFDAPADQPLMQSAARAGIELPSSCRNGSCRTCIGRLLSGRVTYRIDWPGLLREEMAEGWFLPCIAYPATDLVFERPVPSEFPGRFRASSA